MKTKKLLALLLTLAMFLPMVACIVPVSAEETVTELPTETQTVPVETASLTKTKAWDFSDASQLSDFSLYQSATSAFAVADGVLVPNGMDGEVKAILTDTPEKLQSVSVDILPGESGNIYGGLYFGASNAANEQDAINSQVFLIKSDYDPAGWSDAINRIDIVQGQFNNGWKHINTVISETGNRNALFSGSKQALNLKLVFGGEAVLLTLSLVSNSSKFIQLMYEIDTDLLDGQLGLRAIVSDTKFDNLEIVYSEPLPEGVTAYDFELNNQLSDFTLYQPAVSGGRMYAKATGTSMYFWEAVLNQKFPDVRSVSVNMYSTDGGRFFGGFYVGGTDKNLDVGFGNRRGDKTRNEIRVHTGAGHLDKRTDAAGVEFPGAKFFTSKFNPVNLTMVFETDKIIFTITNLDDISKTLSYTYAYDMSKFTGEIGLVSDNSNLNFDEFQVTYGDGTQVNVWNFDDRAQEKAFTYYTPLKSNSYISGGALVSSNQGSGDLGAKIILNEKIEDAVTVSVDISNTGTGRSFGGIVLGGENKIWAIQCGNRRADATRGEIVFKESTGVSEYLSEKKIFEYHKPGGKYGFYSALASQGVNLKLELQADKIIATMTRLDDPAISLTAEYAWDASLFDGTIGFTSDRSVQKYDNFIIERDVTPDIWDFEDATQINDYNLYQPAVCGGKMYAKATGSSKTFWEAVLNQKYEDVKSVSVDMYNNDTARFFGGFFVGGTDKNLDIGFGNRRSNKTRNEIRVHTGAGHMSARTDAAGVEFSGYGFFTTKFNPVNLTLTFESNAIVATITNLDDTTKTLSYTYSFDMSKFTGELGLVSDNSNLYFDNFQIVYGEENQVAVWDFEDHAQEQDFTYYTPLKSNSYISEGALLSSNYGSGNLGAKMILTEQIQDVQTISVDISYANTARNFGGIILGGENTWVAVQCGNRRGDKTRGEIVFLESTGYAEYLSEKKVFEYNKPNGKYGFYSALASQAVNLTLELEDDKIIATMTRLDDPSITKTCEYAWDASGFNGTIGLTSDRSILKFDNLTVKTKHQDDTQSYTKTIYQNDGYNFLETDRWSWEFTKPILETPYTMEAWVKIPKGVSDSKTAYIVDNVAVPPYTSLQLASYGRPNFAYAQEGEGSRSFIADVDIRTGEWTHVAYTYDLAADMVTCYINGEAIEAWEEVGLKPIEFNNTITPFNPFVIGANRNNESIPGKFPGWIADVRLWNSPLTAAEIKDSMMTQYTQPREGLLFNAPLNELVDDKFVDLSGNENYVAETNYKALEWVEDNSQPGAYSMIVVPDHQILANYYPAKLNALYQWIADNREKENIQIVMNVGDMADHCGSNKEWTNTQTALNLLPEDLPYIACPGNHDYDYNSGMGNQNALTLMNQYLPMSKLEGYSTEFGAYSRDRGLEDNVANTWQALEVNGNKYLIIALEYNPSNDVLAWAGDVADAHPNHQVIMLTHSYLWRYGNRAGVLSGNTDPAYKNNGIEMWDKFVSQHENIIMTFSGHTHNNHIVRRVDQGVHGNDVYQILMDAQVADSWYKGIGMLGILRFNEDGTLCSVSYYSPLKDMCLFEDSVFTVQLPKQENKYSALVGLTSYETVTEAAANANGEIVKILKNTDEAIVINNDVTIDLAGYSLSNVTVAEGVKLNLIDSTVTYAETKGSATVSGNVERFVEADGNKYMVIGENGVYAPHRYYVGITHVSLNPGVVGFGYKARFYGDEAVQAQIANIGYDLWLTEDRVVTRTVDKFQNLLTLRLKNFQVDKYGEAPVNAKAFITLVDGTKLESGVNSYSMKQMVELINESYADLSATQLQAVAMMIKDSQTMMGWNVTNILNALKPSATVESITVTDQTMTLPDGTSNTVSLNGAYRFTTNETAETLAYSEYTDWIADYYITMDKEAGEGLYLAGNYGDYGWILIPVEAGKTYTAVPVVQTLLGKSLTYAEMVNDVISFSCGVADSQGTNASAVVTVELRLTNPENPEEFITIHTNSLTIA